MSEARPYGVIGVFAEPQAVLEAARQLRALGFGAVEAYAPYPVEGLDEAVRPPPRPLLPLAIVVGALLGAGYGWFLQYWDEVLSYPLNVGGRPHDSWPAFIVSGFEITLLFAVAAGFFALLAACRLPRLHHPIFAAQGFGRATSDRFLLCVEASDPGFEPQSLRQFFDRHGAERVEEVVA